MNKAGDVTFTTYPGILGAQVTWNVTRIERDARDGAFGKQISVPMSILAPLTREMAANIDWRKVEKMLGAHLQRPNESTRYSDPTSCGEPAGRPYHENSDRWQPPHLHPTNSRLSGFQVLRRPSEAGRAIPSSDNIGDNYAASIGERGRLG